MFQRKSRVAVLAALLALALPGGCHRPTRDPATLGAIKAEARMLMRAYPVAANLPRARWPHTIASLEPEFVTIDPAGVYITTRPYFDGGWGYFVPREGGNLPEPAERFEEAGQGVYWWHPY